MMNRGAEVYTFREGGILWTVNKQGGRPLEHTLLNKIESILSTRATLVKQNMCRAVYFLRLNGAKEGIYVKRYSVGDWKATLLSLGSGPAAFLGVTLPVFFSQARREWEMMLEMKEKGLPVPLPLALGQKTEGREPAEYLVTQEIPDGRPIRDCTRFDKDTLLKALAILTASLHKSNIFFRDLQLGNVLLSTRNLRPELYLLDLHSARSVRSLGIRHKVWMLAKLLSSFEPFGGATAVFDCEDQERFLELYARGMPDFRKEFSINVARVKALADKIRLNHLKSRTQRCMKDSTSFTVEDHDGWRVYRRRDFATEEVFRLLREYEGPAQKALHPPFNKGGQGGITAGDDKGIKSTSKTHLKILEAVSAGGPGDKEKGRVCVKHYWCNGVLDYLKGQMGLSRARRAWVIGNGLLARGVPTAEPLALVEDPEEAFLLSRALTDFPRLDYYILENFRGVLDYETERRKKGLIVAVARMVRLLHDKRVYHGDLKACNILVEELPKDNDITGSGAWQFYLIDYDRVVFDKEISPRRRAKNLAQLHTSIPWCISRADRMRFYREYSRGLGLDKKPFLRKVLEFSARRIPVLMEPIE